MRTGALPGFIYEIHRVLWVSAEPWMSEITPRKAPVLKLFVLQIFLRKFGE